MKVHPQEPNDKTTVTMSDGAEIEVRRYGRSGGTRIIGSHGNGFAVDGYWAFWSAIPDDIELILFDLRNHGGNPRHIRDHHRIAQFADDMNALLIAIEARYGARTTIGLFHSVSAITSFVHALKYGWQWDALVVVDPPLIPSPTHPQFEFAQGFEQRISAWAADRRPDFDSPQQLEDILKKSGSRQAWLEGTHGAMARSVLRKSADGSGWTLACPGPFEAQIYADNATLDLCPNLGGIKGPLMFACADPKLDNAWSPAIINREIAPFHGHHYVAFPGTTHMLQLEQPMQVWDSIQTFLVASGIRNTP